MGFRLVGELGSGLRIECATPAVEAGLTAVAATLLEGLPEPRLGPRTARVDTPAGPMVIRRFAPAGWPRASGARQAWLAAHRLRAAGLATARPLGLVERAGGPSIAAFEPLELAPFEAAPREARRQALRELGRGLGRLRDLGAALTAPPRVGWVAGALVLLEVDRLGPARVDGLVHLWPSLAVSSADRLRVIEGYLAGWPADRALRRALLPTRGERPSPGA